MSSLYPNPENALDNTQESEVQGAAFHTTSENGVAIMPPKQNFEQNTHSKSQEENSPDREIEKEGGDNTWVTPRDNEKINSKEQAKKKLSEINAHINFLLGMAEKMPGDIKKPESIGELVNLASECDEIRKVITEEDDGTPHLDYTDAELLNAISDEIEYSYGDVFMVIATQAERASKNIASIPTLDQLDGALREMLRANFEEEKEGELNKIMNALEGTEKYNRMVNLMKSTALKAANKIRGVAWAEYLETLESSVKDGLEQFVAKADFVYTFINNLAEIFGSDPNHATEGLRKTFDAVDTIIGNPFLKASFPLWAAYKPAIDFCLDGIDQIARNVERNKRLIGISRGLDIKVRKNQQDQIDSSMCSGLPGNTDEGKRELLVFMMDIHAKGIRGISDIKASPSVVAYFFDHKDLINSGDGRDKLGVDYGFPIYSGDDKFTSLEFDVWQHRAVIWSMLYGKLLDPPE